MFYLSTWGCENISVYFQHAPHLPNPNVVLNKHLNNTLLLQATQHAEKGNLRAVDGAYNTISAQVRTDFLPSCVGGKGKHKQGLQAGKCIHLPLYS